MDPNQLVPEPPKPQNLNLVITPETSFHSVADQIIKQQQVVNAFRANAAATPAQMFQAAPQQLALPQVPVQPQQPPLQLVRQQSIVQQPLPQSQPYPSLPQAPLPNQVPVPHVQQPAQASQPVQNQVQLSKSLNLSLHYLKLSSSTICKSLGLRITFDF